MRRGSIGVLAALALAVAACSSGDDGGTTGPTAATGGATAPTGAATGGTADAGCTEDSATDLSEEPAFTVIIADFTFSPDCFIASASASYSIENQDGVTHTFTIDGAPIDRSINGGQSTASIGATPGVVAGTYDFSCTIHPSMTGTVIFV